MTTRRSLGGRTYGRTIDLGFAADLLTDARFVARCRKYGVTVGRVVATYEKQGRACGICSKGAPITALVFDHNHLTGAFRGMLCGNCNTGLGLLGDSLVVVAAATTYLSDRGSYGRAPLGDGLTEDRALVWLREIELVAYARHHNVLGLEQPTAREHRKYKGLRKVLGFGAPDCAAGECVLCATRASESCLPDCRVCEMEAAMEEVPS